MVPAVSCLHHIVHVIVNADVLIFVQMVAVGTAKSEIRSDALTVGLTVCLGITPVVEHIVVGILHLGRVRWSLNLIVHIVLYLG